MNTPLLVGLYGAWAAVQVAIGAFFLQAFVARRREREFLLFGLVCFGLAVTDGGLSVAAALHGVEHWTIATAVSHVAAFFSTALNVHFVLQFVAPNKVRRFVPAAYGLAAAYSAVLVLGGWWVPGTVHLVHSATFGIVIDQVSAQPTPLGASAYLCTTAANVGNLYALALAYRRGRRDVRGTFIGLSIVMACSVSDVLTIVLQLGTPPLLPYGFLIYGFGVADTLLVRYRRAAEELEVTASELRQATEELTSSYLELSTVQEELFRKRQLASVGELAASIAHEVRNPLAIIVNAAANLKRANLGPDDRNTLFGIIEEEIVRLNKIVTELLRYARPMNVRREEVSFTELVKQLREGLGESYAVDVQVAAAADVETVWADPNLLRLALQNLIDNARQSMPDGGAVVVSAARERAAGISGVRIEVTDTGHGMDSRTLHRAMDPFFSTRPSGTGLGLPITGRIIEAHGGKLDVHSRVGEGTTVAFFIPGKRPDRVSEPRLSAEPRP